ncbi:SiaB family protein kinase [Magnetospira thiophila]
MLIDSMYDFRNYLQTRGILFCYSGYVTEEILSGIGDAIKRKLVMDDADTKTTRAVFSVFIEQMQNIIRYSAEMELTTSPEKDELRYGVLLVGKKDGSFFVTCANMIRTADVARLEDWLSMVQGMDRQELKDTYKKKLRDHPPEGSKGAGIGFLDIARRASRPIEFTFENIGDEFTFFTLNAYV